MKRQFIKVAEEFEGQFDKTFCHLGLSALYQIALLPTDQRDQPHTIPSTGEVKTVDVTFRRRQTVGAAHRALLGVY
ncbi:hypothetical protein QPM05_06200 [Caldibacillus thermoamylovorans]|nr:hypothetical protein [Caldibacillus thermoamylovorans]